MSDQFSSMFWIFPAKHSSAVRLGRQETEAVLSRIPDQIRNRLNELGFGLIFRHPTPDTHCQARGMFAITDVGLEVEYDDRITFGIGDIAWGDVHDVVAISECPAHESFPVTSWGGPCRYALLSRKPLPQRRRAVCLNRALFVLVSALHDALNGCPTVTTNDLVPSRNDKLISALENLDDHEDESLFQANHQFLNALDNPDEHDDENLSQQERRGSNRNQHPAKKEHRSPKKDPNASAKTDE